MHALILIAEVDNFLASGGSLHNLQSADDGRSNEVVVRFCLHGEEIDSPQERRKATSVELSVHEPYNVAEAAPPQLR